VGGTGSGKTWYSPYWIIKRLEKPQSRLLAIGLGYEKHVQRVMVNRLAEFFDNYKIAYTFNKTAQEMTLRHNGSQIIFGSAENAMSLEGTHLEGGCWIDEAGQMPRIAWDVADRRTKLFKAPTLITTVPYFYNWLKTDIYDPWLAGDRNDVDWIHCRSLDNLIFDEKDIEEVRKRRRPEYFEIFYEGNFAKPYGLIYDDPDTKDLIVDIDKEFPNGIPVDWPMFSGHDFGINDPNAAVWGILSPNDVLFIVAEYEAPTLTMRSHIDRWNRAGLGTPDMAFGDPSGADQMLTAGELGFSVQKTNNDILAGIDLVYDRFKTNRLRIFPGCRQLIDYREQYVWKKNPRNEDELMDKPEDPQNSRHMMDALRYLVMGIFENYGSAQEGGPLVVTRRRFLDRAG
jgi:hypothetical protein